MNGCVVYTHTCCEMISEYATCQEIINAHINASLCAESGAEQYVTECGAELFCED